MRTELCVERRGNSSRIQSANGEGSLLARLVVMTVGYPHGYPTCDRPPVYLSREASILRADFRVAVGGMPKIEGYIAYVVAWIPRTQQHDVRDSHDVLWDRHRSDACGHTKYQPSHRVASRGRRVRGRWLAFERCVGACVHVILYLDVKNRFNMFCAALYPAVHVNECICTSQPRTASSESC